MLNARSDAFVAGPAQAMAQARREFAHVVGSNDEVVEEVLAEREVVELVVIEQQDDRPDVRARAGAAGDTSSWLR